MASRATIEYATAGPLELTKEDVSRVQELEMGDVNEARTIEAEDLERI